VKIGFPRALFYYDYFPFWSGFFSALDIKVVTSPPTHRQIMEQGLRRVSDDTCLPIKLLAGHIQALEDVDAIFLPRMVSVEANTYSCPKFLGIPESLLPAVPPGIPVLTVTVNWRKGKRQVLKDLQVLGLQLGKGRADIRKAFTLGQEWQKRYQDSNGSGWDFEKNLPQIESTAKRIASSQKDTVPLNEPGRLRIALVGHSYLTQEPYANLNLLRRLRKKAEVELVQNVNLEEVNNHLSGLRKKIFWNHAKQIFGAGKKFITDPDIDGIIYLSCFGCGTDSIVQGLLASSARETHKPYMMITLDEHSGEAGLVTRLEAFLDMVERRKVHEGYVSAHGEHLDSDSNSL